jgi:hypothetical protein
MIVTFLALLELLKLNLLNAIRTGNFGEIVLAPPGIGRRAIGVGRSAHGRAPWKLIS